MNHTLPALRKVGYSIGAYGMMLPWFIQSVFLFYFYTDVLGITPEQAGTIFFIAVLWDAVTDPVMGVLADRTRTRWGRYRPYLLFASVPLALSLIGVFLKPDWPIEKLFILALVSHLLFRLCFTLIYIPYTSMLAKISQDTTERSSVAAYKTVATSLGTLTVSLVTLKLVAYFGNGDETKGFLATATLYAVLMVCSLWVCFLSTTEVSESEGAFETERYDILSVGKILMKNVPFLLVFFGVITFTGCYTIMLKSIVYFFKYNLGDAESARWGLSAASVSGIFAVPIWATVTKRTSKRLVWIAGCILASSGLLVLNLHDGITVIWAVVNIFVVGCGIAAFLMTFYAMAADTIDYGEWKYGVRIEALSISILSFANKSSLAIGGGSLGFMMASVGYKANVEQSVEALEGIKSILTLVPLTGFLLSAVVIHFYPIDAKYHQKIRDGILARTK
jgi:glycoside/pentoside/hexuronide:cation symporter, GPH family